MHVKNRLSALLALILAAVLLAGCVPAASPAPAAETAAPQPTAYLPLVEGPAESAAPDPTATPAPIAEDGYYYSRDEVALYIHTYGRLPGNFITKEQARALGWNGGSVEAYAPEMAIGGNVFENNEGLLPWASGRIYYECDIDTLHYRDRGSRRIVFSNDGLIYYTGNHYKTFVLLYGEE